MRVKQFLQVPEPRFPRHLMSIHDLEREHIEYLFTLAQRLEESPGSEYADVLGGQLVGSLFYQPSTRTRLSFEAAALRLGGKTLGFADANQTRAGDFYQETLEDVIANIAEMVDCIVLRHFEDSAVTRAAEASRVPVISGGIGYREHPTQALGDIWTMYRALGGLDGAVVGLVGDVAIRSLRPISIGLSRFRVKKVMYLCAPGTDVPDEVATCFRERGVAWEHVDDVRDLLRRADVVETIGIRHPRHDVPRQDEWDPEVTTPARYRIDRATIEALGSTVPILHPGARKDELDPDVDSLPNARYFPEVRYNMLIRMAVLARMLTPASGAAPSVPVPALAREASPALAAV